MSDAKTAEAPCPACGRVSLLLRKPKYDGFTKVGEETTCATCGHVFADAEVPAAAPKQPDIFANDHSKKIELFLAGEAEKLCGHCVHYTVNPFRQWCARHRRDVEATDTCADYAPRPPEKPAPPPEPPKKNILLALLASGLIGLFPRGCVGSEPKDCSSLMPPLPSSDTACWITKVRAECRSTFQLAIRL
jgi:hypothetical protein